MRRAIFFDAVGTLFRLTKSVGQHYALVAERQGLHLDAAQLDRAFTQVWREMPLRPATGLPRPDDDKDWWRELVDRMLDMISARIDPLDRGVFFEAAYAHFAEAGVWELFPEVFAVLETLAPRFTLAIVSNFDGRLRMVLRHLAIGKFFTHVFVSSEVGADKPDPLIYRRALELSGLAAGEVWYVGDDPERDWNGARDAGLEVFRLERPRNSLCGLLENRADFLSELF